MERLGRREPVETVVCTYTTVRGIMDPRAKVVRGVMYRCTSCGRLYSKPRDAREHAVYECTERH